MRDTLGRLRAQLEPLGISPVEGIALLVLLSGALALTAVVWWSTQPGPQTTSPGSAIDLEVVGTLHPTGPDPPAAPTAPATLVVHVAGHVRRPGVVSLPVGARVGEAIDAAGGPTADAVLDAVNLARPLADGEQVRVPGPGETPAPIDAAAAAPSADPLLDLNTATVDQLVALPGVGPVTAERIVAHREAIGGFAAITQLLEVPGIGPARFADLEARVRL